MAFSVSDCGDAPLHLTSAARPVFAVEASLPQPRLIKWILSPKFRNIFCRQAIRRHLFCINESTYEVLSRSLPALSVDLQT
jgi:hypothetical protein